MKLEQALEILTPMIGQTIEINENVANKGKFGHALEKFLELKILHSSFRRMTHSSYWNVFDWNFQDFGKIIFLRTIGVTYFFTHIRFSRQHSEKFAERGPFRVS